MIGQTPGILFLVYKLILHISWFLICIFECRLENLGEKGKYASPSPLPNTSDPDLKSYDGSYDYEFLRKLQNGELCEALSNRLLQVEEACSNLGTYICTVQP